MKRKLFILSLALTAIVLLYSCKKDLSRTLSNTEIATKVNAWLDQKQLTMNEGDKKKLVSLKENLDFSLMYEESFNLSESLLSYL
jgi:type III secretory pathway lipoprotein EscJ